MKYIPPTRFAKVQKDIRNNYFEMAAELAGIHGMYNGKDDVERCVSCGCVVDKDYHGHHSAADCRILRFAEEYNK